MELSTLSLRAVHRRLYTVALLIGKCQKGPAESGHVITYWNLDRRSHDPSSACQVHSIFPSVFTGTPAYQAYITYLTLETDFPLVN